MPDAEYILIPLRRRDGTIKAHAIIDECDAHLALSRWCLDSEGYACRKLGGKVVRLHREVLGLSPGDGLQADHIDRDRLNCRRLNLRLATHALNGQNRASNAGSSSRYRGVSWNSGKWHANAKLNGVQHHLGRFDDEGEAAAVVSAWRVANMPFANEEGPKVFCRTAANRATVGS